MESSDESHDMSKGQLSSTTTVNNASPNPPLVPNKAGSNIGIALPPTSRAKRPTWAAARSEFSLPPTNSRTRKLELDEKELVTVTEKTSQLYSQGKVEKIPKEEAICKFCFTIFQEDNVLKTNCRCNFTLIHESCATEWSQKKGDNKCDVCEQDIQNIPVTLSMNHNSSNNNKMVKRNSAHRRFCRCFGL